MPKFSLAGLAVFIILVAVTIAIIAYVMANGSTPIGPSPEGGSGSAIIGEDDLTPVIDPVLVINAGTALQGVDSGSGRFTLNVITPTPQPTSTPQPTATPGAGGGFPFEVGRSSVSGGSAQLYKPGVKIHSVGNRTIVSGTIYYEPFFVFDTIGVTSFMFESTGGTGDATVCRTGIYEIDTDWQPTNLVVDAGTATMTAGGVKTITIASESLVAGRYAAVFGCNGTVDLRLWTGEFQSDISPTGTINSILAERSLASQAAQITGGFSDPGSDWTGTTYNNVGSYHYVMLGATP